MAGRRPPSIQRCRATAVWQLIVAGCENRMPAMAVTRIGSSTPQPFTLDEIGASFSPMISGSPQIAPAMAFFFLRLLLRVSGTGSGIGAATGCTSGIWPRPSGRARGRSEA